MSRLPALSDADITPPAPSFSSSEVLLAQKQIARLRHNVGDATAKRKADARSRKLIRRFFAFLIFLFLSCISIFRRSTTLRLPRRAKRSEIPDDSHAITDCLRPNLSTLPPEIVVEILAYLSPREISSAERICQYLHNVVVSSSALQYTVERHLPCVDEGPLIPSLSSHAERLHHLGSWRDASQRERGIRKVLEHHEATPVISWGAHGSVIWRHDRRDKAIDFRVLPSNTSNRTGRKKWRIIYPRPFILMGVHYDSTDDLLMCEVIDFDENSMSAGMTLTFRQGTTGQSHPNAPASFWRASILGLRIMRPRVQLREGLVLVNYVTFKDSREEERNLVIIDWKTVDLTVFTMSSPYGTPEEMSLKMLSFVSPDLLATFVHTSTDGMELVVFLWRNLPPGRLTIEDALPFATKFQLPPAAEGWSYEFPTDWTYQESRGEISWNPQPKQQAYTESLFVPSDCGRPQNLVRLLYNMKGRADHSDRSYSEGSIDVPQFVLTSLVASRGAGQVVSWNDWGTNTRISPSMYTRRYVYGNKMVTIRRSTAISVPETIKIIVDRFDSLDSLLKHVDEDIVAEPSNMDFLNPRKLPLFYESALEKAALPYRSTTYDTGIVCSTLYIKVLDVGDDCVILGQKIGEEQCVHVFAI